MRKRMLKIFILAIFVGFLLPVQVTKASVFDDLDSLMKRVTFSTSEPGNVSLDNGVSIHFTNPLPGFIGTDCGKDYFVAMDINNSQISYTLTLEGVDLSIKNDSDQVQVIKWGESSINIGDYSGVPFLDGMKYRDAGNPSATPDTVLSPGQTLSKNVYISRTEFDRQWSVKGIPIPIAGQLPVTLALKIVNGSGASNYFSIKSPSIYVKSKTDIFFSGNLTYGSK